MKLPQECWGGGLQFILVDRAQLCLHLLGSYQDHGVKLNWPGRTYFSTQRPCEHHFFTDWKTAETWTEMEWSTTKLAFEFDSMIMILRFYDCILTVLPQTPTVQLFISTVFPAFHLALMWPHNELDQFFNVRANL